MRARTWTDGLGAVGRVRRGGDAHGEDREVRNFPDEKYGLCVYIKARAALRTEWHRSRSPSLHSVLIRTRRVEHRWHRPVNAAYLLADTSRSILKALLDSWMRACVCVWETGSRASSPSTTLQNVPLHPLLNSSIFFYSTFMGVLFTWIRALSFFIIIILFFIQ